ncbi:hypothetical protein LBMAG48_28820 [Phycisphaerae bacterium]|nr:hypothetical protein LBMAG48_28820 [Phycisphaerae bacterium]
MERETAHSLSRREFLGASVIILLPVAASASETRTRYADTLWVLEPTGRLPRPLRMDFLLRTDEDMLIDRRKRAISIRVFHAPALGSLRLENVPIHLLQRIPSNFRDGVPGLYIGPASSPGLPCTVCFPPQHLAEQVFAACDFEEVSQQLRIKGTIPLRRLARLAGNSKLDITIPPGMAPFWHGYLPLDATNILTWRNVALKPDVKNLPDGSPSQFIEAPLGMLLVPTTKCTVKFDSSVGRLVTDHEQRIQRMPLWAARMTAQTKSKDAESTTVGFDVRRRPQTESGVSDQVACCASDYNDSLTYLPKDSDANKIVNPDSYLDPCQPLVTVKHAMISSIGLHADIQTAVRRPEVGIEKWTHRIRFGRDLEATVAYGGLLWPFLIPAVLIQRRNREIHEVAAPENAKTLSVATLRETWLVELKQQYWDYAKLEPEKYGADTADKPLMGMRWPFRRVEVQETQTQPLNVNCIRFESEECGGSARYAWLCLERGHVPVRFHVKVTDRNGSTREATCPMFWVSKVVVTKDDPSSDKVLREAMAEYETGVPRTPDPDNLPKPTKGPYPGRTMNLGGFPLTMVSERSGLEGDAKEPNPPPVVHDVVFGIESTVENNWNHSTARTDGSDWEARIHPTMESASATSRSISPLFAGAPDAEVRVKYTDEFAKFGLMPRTKNKGKPFDEAPHKNPTDSILSVLNDPPKLPFPQAPSSSLINPTVTVGTLSRTLGPMGLAAGQLQEVANLAKDFFASVKDGCDILGCVGLGDVVAPIRDATKVAEQLPTMLAREVERVRAPLDKLTEISDALRQFEHVADFRELAQTWTDRSAMLVRAFRDENTKVRSTIKTMTLFALHVDRARKTLGMSLVGSIPREAIERIRATVSDQDEIKEIIIAWNEVQNVRTLEDVFAGYVDELHAVLHAKIAGGIAQFEYASKPLIEYIQDRGGSEVRTREEQLRDLARWIESWMQREIEANAHRLMSGWAKAVSLVSAELQQNAAQVEAWASVARGVLGDIERVRDTAEQLLHDVQTLDPRRIVDAAGQLDDNLTLLKDVLGNPKSILAARLGAVSKQVESYYGSLRSQLADATCAARLAYDKAIKDVMRDIKIKADNEVNEALLESLLAWHSTPDPTLARQALAVMLRGAVERELTTVLQEPSKRLDAKLKDWREQATEAISKAESAVKEFGSNVVVEGWKAISSAISPVAKNLTDQYEEVRDLSKKLKKELEDATTPTLFHISHRWGTTLQEAGPFVPRRGRFPAQASAIAKAGQANDLEFALDIEMDASLIEQRVDTRSVVHVALRDFDLRLIGGSPFLTVAVERLAFTSVNGAAPVVDLKIASIAFGQGLAMLAELARAISPKNGPKIDIDSRGISAGFGFGFDKIAAGAFGLRDLRFGLHLLLPFTGERATVELGISSRAAPFLVNIGIFGGGGFFALRVSAKGVESMEASIEFGGLFELDVVVASGRAEVLAGIYYRRAADALTISGYVRASGRIVVLGFFKASIELFVGITYEKRGRQSVVYGEARVTIEISLFFFDISVGFSVRHEFQGSTSDESTRLSSNTSVRTTMRHIGDSVQSPERNLAAWADNCILFNELQEGP